MDVERIDEEGDKVKDDIEEITDVDVPDEEVPSGQRLQHSQEEELEPASKRAKLLHDEELSFEDKMIFLEVMRRCHQLAKDAYMSICQEIMRNPKVERKSIIKSWNS